MVETVIRTRELPAADRFDFWLETVARTVVPVKARSEHTADFGATIRSVHLGGIQASLMDHPALEAHRTPRLIRRSDPEFYHLTLNLAGPAEVRQAGRSTVLQRGDITLYDSSRPFSCFHGGGQGLVVLIPRDLLPLPENRVRKLLLAGLSSREGIGALAAGYLREMVANAGRYRPADAARLATVSLDLIAAMLAHRLDDEVSLPPEVGHRALLVRIHAFIQHHLGDPALSPGTVAAAHNISTRHLHKLFQEQDLTVAAWIRQRRLDRCCHDLADPLLHSRPIHVIAARWGFANVAHFSRVFRAVYGIAPRDYRQLHAGDTVRAMVTRVRSSSTTS